jgi:hypothetical protein
MNKLLLSILFILSVTSCWAGVTFDGTNDGILLPDIASFDGALSIAAWVRIHTATDDSTVLAQYNGVLASSSFLFRINTNRLPSYVTTAGSAATVKTCVEALTLNTWTHVAMTTTGATENPATNTHLYINGAECTYGAENATTNITDEATGLSIGRRSDANDEADGDYLEVTAWSSALTAAQVALLAQNKVMRSPLQIPTILIDYPLDECADGVECGAFKDIAMGNTAQGAYGTVGFANPVLTYP